MASAAESGDRSMGPLITDFHLTLGEGRRTEAVGPFYYWEEKDGLRTWAVPPFVTHASDPDTDFEEFDILYPILTYDRYGSQYRWQLGQLLSFSGGPGQRETNRSRFTLFPVYFQQRSSNPEQNYTAVFPFYGHLKRRMFRDEISFVMFPIYGQSRRKDVVTDNYVYPFFHLRHGVGLRGWQFWPMAGYERKAVTTTTNGFNDVVTIAGHEKRFIMWPFYFNEKTGLGTDNPESLVASIPFYSQLRSPRRDTTGVFLFNHVVDREKKYHEWDLPWLLMVFARGEGKTTTRVWPFFSKAHSPTLQSDFIMWPIYKYNRVHSEPLERERKRVAFFLYSDLTEKNTETGKARRRTDLWPLFTKRQDFDGNSRLQVLAPLEPFVTGSHKIDRDYSPLWSVWRSEHNPTTGAASKSLLWNLYRLDTRPATRKCSVFFGLYQSRSGPEGSETRLFHISLGRSK